MLILTILLLAGPPAEIPEAWWDVDRELAQYNTDAVILEDRTTVNVTEVKRFRRVRILNRWGKSAAEIVELGRLSGSLKGRVIDRKTGKVTVLNRREDLIKLTIARYRGDKEKATVVLPPGLTDDCIVELSWAVPAENGLSNGWEDIHPMSEVWPVRKKTVTFSIMARRTGLIGLSWTAPTASGQFQKTDTSSGLQVIYKDLAPEPRYPFSRDLATFYVLAYRQFPRDFISAKNYYDDIGDALIRAMMGDKPRGGAYKSWIKGLKKELPKDPFDAMNYLFKAFTKQITREDLLTAEQRANLKRAKKNDDFSKVAATTFANGYGSSFGIQTLFYHTARDLKIPFKVVVADSRHGAIFARNVLPNQRNLVGLNLNYYLFSVLYKGENTVYFDPAEQAAVQPYVLTDFQGQAAVAFNPYKKWKHEIVTLPVLPHSIHTRRHQFMSMVRADGSLKLSMKQTSTGRFQTSMVEDYRVMPQQERDERLKKQWQKNWRTRHVERAAVILSPGAAIAEVDVTTPPSGVEHMVLHPFPGTYVAIHRPSAWPKGRKKAVFLYPFVQEDTHAINVGDTFRLKGNPNWERRNAAGSVQFRAEQQDGKVMVTRRVDVPHPAMRPDAEKELKQLLAWIDESEDQRLLLERIESGEDAVSRGEE